MPIQILIARNFLPFGVLGVLIFAPAVYGQQGKTAGSAEWAKLVDAAKKEGKVTVSIPASAELKKQIEESMESVSDIRRYIGEQKDLYLATPAGWPVPGRISSGYGRREHPLSGDSKFHSGLDISVPRGTRVATTADGIVSYSGWSPGGGNTVVIEHGHGFSTAYAHNERNLVRVGQRVRRGNVIAVSGSTGTSTGPHIHYEIWKGGRHVNPETYLARG